MSMARLLSLSNQTIKMGDATDNSQGKLILYTNHGCPWAQRAHIILKELGLPHEEVIIDLERPRDEWYLKINDVSASLKTPSSNHGDLIRSPSVD